MCTELPPQALETAPPESTTGGSVTRRTALLASAGLAGSAVLDVAGALPAAADGRGSRRGRLDLTYTLGEDFPGSSQLRV